MFKLFAAVFLLTSALVTATEQFGSDTYDEEFIKILRDNGFDESQIEEIIGEYMVEEAHEHEAHEHEPVSWGAAAGYEECAAHQHGHEEEYKPKPLADVCKENECPDIEVLPSGCGYEARKILAGKWVSTSMGVDNIPAEITAAFMRLLKYISGTNDQKLKIAMTVPVVCKWFWDPTAPYTVTGASMHFYLPKAVAAAAPAPTDESVHLENWVDTVMYDRAFGGDDESEEIYNHELEKLYKAIAKDGKSFHVGISVTAGYTRPHHGQQRKEVMFFAKDQ